MYRIYCDETWTRHNAKVQKGYYVFYGVMVEESCEAALIQHVDSFRQKRGLLSQDGSSIEIKWQKVEDEWKQAQTANRSSRYAEFLDLFFEALKARELSFGYMFVKSEQYKKVESEFLKQQPDNKQNFFFMLYFQFLYHCFIRPQVKQNPCQVLIDNRNMGAEGAAYDIEKLREILNRRLYRDSSPRNQLNLSSEFQRQIADSISLINLAESKQEPLIQLADLCAGCVRYALENQLQPPPPQGQMPMFENSVTQDNVTPGRSELTNYFYSKLRSIDRYKDINLLKLSRHHRFNIFPFEFGN